MIQIRYRWILVGVEGQGLERPIEKISDLGEVLCSR